MLCHALYSVCHAYIASVIHTQLAMLVARQLQLAGLALAHSCNLQVWHWHTAQFLLEPT